uniref:Uncharacterized protein n=1 Tax=Arundo donax TaxID=35708 RepID=A0A0A8ZDZ4_ARUDO
MHSCLLIVSVGHPFLCSFANLKLSCLFCCIMYHNFIVHLARSTTQVLP